MGNLWKIFSRRRDVRASGAGPLGPQCAGRSRVFSCYPKETIARARVAVSADGTRSNWGLYLELHEP